jgi:uncharacterized protein with von Willebrand factor type A (vWA) domain
MSPALAANLVAFGRLLRDAGLAVTPDQTRIFADALARLGTANRRDVKAAGRAIFVRRREEIGVYDDAFDLFFRRSSEGGASGPAGGSGTGLPTPSSSSPSPSSWVGGRRSPTSESPPSCSQPRSAWDVSASVRP